MAAPKHVNLINNMSLTVARVSLLFEQYVMQYITRHRRGVLPIVYCLQFFLPLRQIIEINVFIKSRL